MLILNALSDPRVAELLLDGKLGVLPTDTVYGLACRAADAAAVALLYELKNREGKPGTVIAADIDQLAELGIKARYVKAVQDYWPNPISIIMPCGDELSYIHQGLYGIAARIPDDKPLRTLLQKTGPLLTTSANHPGEPEAVNVRQAKEYFGDSIDFCVDGGDLSDRQPSTVIRIVDDEIEVLREGAVKIDPNGRIIR